MFNFRVLLHASLSFACLGSGSRGPHARVRDISGACRSELLGGRSHSPALPAHATMVLRRALLYVPASSPRMITKSRLLPTLDTVTYDLEDSVTPALKSLARTHITQTLNLPRAPGIREQSVRINDIRSGYAENDLCAAVRRSYPRLRDFPPSGRSFPRAHPP